MEFRISTGVRVAGANGMSRRPLATPIFELSQRAVPIGQRILPLFPEPLSRATLAGALRRWPSLWGMFEDGKRVQAARQAYSLAFPDENAETFTTRWIASRGEDLAGSLIHMARENAGRSSRLLCTKSVMHLARDRPRVVAFLHYSIDPVLQLSLLAARPERNYRWPLYPLQPGIEDDRSLWLAGRKIPAGIERTFLPVTESTWLIDAVRHIEGGGDILVAMDTPFDCKRRPAALLKVGKIAMPLAPAIEFLARRTEAQLLFAWPEPRPGKMWILNFEAVADTHALAAAATQWIDGNRYRWAGWPYLRWRETSVSMRQNVSRLTQLQASARSRSTRNNRRSSESDFNGEIGRADRDSSATARDEGEVWRLSGDVGGDRGVFA
jgi:hypothetical protein